MKIGIQPVEFPQVHVLSTVPGYPVREINGQSIEIGRTGLSFDPRYLHTGGNSGFQAANCAVLFGGNPIVLIGYDMSPGADGKTLHCHPDHIGPVLTNPNAAQMTRWAKEYATMVPDLAKAGVKVINASRRSAIDAFPRMSLAEALS